MSIEQGSGETAPAVQAIGLVRRFGDTVAVNRVDLAVQPGEVFGLLGPNGAGKTTTLRMLCGLVVPTAGEARICGIDVWRRPREARARLGYLAKGPTWFPALPGRGCLYSVG